ncbi:MAG: HEAT repeat domain-containing protein [Methanomicrobiales archaeon]
MTTKSKERNNGWFSQFAGTSLIYHIMANVMNGKDREERIRAVKSLGERGDPRAVVTLMNCCDDPDPEIRTHAIDALSLLRSGRSVPTLIRHLDNDSELPQTRQKAAMALAAIHSHSAIECLMDHVDNENEDPALREYIAVLIGGREYQ